MRPRAARTHGRCPSGAGGSRQVTAGWEEAVNQVNPDPERYFSSFPTFRYQGSIMVSLVRLTAAVGPVLRHLNARPGSAEAAGGLPGIPTWNTVIGAPWEDTARSSGE